MLHLIGLLLASAVALSVAAAQPQANSSAVPRETTVCELARSTSDAGSNFVSVKAQLLLDQHWGGITDDRCPDEIVFLAGMQGGPSMAFCELNFGCPANTEDFRITATFIGYYQRAGNEPGRLRLKELRDANRTPK